MQVLANNKISPIREIAAAADHVTQEVDINITAKCTYLITGVTAAICC